MHFASEGFYDTPNPVFLNEICLNHALLLSNVCTFDFCMYNGKKNVCTMKKKKKKSNTPFIHIMITLDCGYQYLYLYLLDIKGQHQSN